MDRLEQLAQELADIWANDAKVINRLQDIQDAKDHLTHVWGVLDVQWEKSPIEAIREFEKTGHYLEYERNAKLGEPTGDALAFRTYPLDTINARKESLVAKMSKEAVFRYAMEEDVWDSPLRKSASLRIESEGWKGEYREYKVG